MFAFFYGLFEYFDQGSSAFVFLRADCECNRVSVLATVFWSASAFNGDLNKWDVATVSDMSGRKSLRIVANDLS